MSCYHPLTAYRTKGGDITFRQGQGVGSEIKLPCGQCIGCRLERSRQWAMRCMYESQMHVDNCFLTLTYSDEYLPSGGSLRGRDFSLFIKRLRKRISPKRIRFFACGEYGSEGRAHYHAIIFGHDFSDKTFFKKSPSGEPVFISETLTSVWGLGHATIGDVTFDSCGYVARYCLKKVNGDRKEAHYRRIVPETGEIIDLVPEFSRMSLKPGIGKDWYEKFRSDVFPSDFLVVNGQRVNPPRYFDNLLKREDEDLLERIKLKRVRQASRFKADQRPERLKVREKVVKARVSQLKREGV